MEQSKRIVHLSQRLYSVSSSPFTYIRCFILRQAKENHVNKNKDNFRTKCKPFFNYGNIRIFFHTMHRSDVLEITLCILQFWWKYLIWISKILNTQMTEKSQPHCYPVYTYIALWKKQIFPPFCLLSLKFQIRTRF